MNGNLNTALLLIENLINKVSDKGFLSDDVKQIKQILLDELESDEKEKKELNNAHNLLQEMRDDGMDFQFFTQKVSSFLGLTHEEENKVFCPFCGEEFNEEDGLECENGEGVCSDDCLSQYDVG